MEHWNLIAELAATYGVMAGGAGLFMKASGTGARIGSKLRHCNKCGHKPHRCKCPICGCSTK